MLSRFLLRSGPFSESFFSKLPRHCLRSISSTVQATGPRSETVKKSISIKHKEDEEIMKKLKSLEAERGIKSNVVDSMRFSSVEFSGSKEDVEYVTEALEKYFPGLVLSESENQVIDIILNFNDSLENLLENTPLSFGDFSNFMTSLSGTGGLESAKINMIVRERPLLQYGSVKAYSIGPNAAKTASSNSIQFYHDATKIINVSITHNLCDGTKVGYKVQQQLVNAFRHYLIVIDSVSIPIPTS